jgi:ComF family protein
MGPAAAILDLIVPPACWACGARARRGEPLCLGCRVELRWLERRPVELAGIATWAPVAYDGPARALVRGLKFGGALGLAGPMAAQVAACAPDGLLRPPALLVPVPLDPRRARGRGYNQAERLATALGRRTGMRVADCLRRSGVASGSQVGRGRGERLAALAGAIERRPGARVAERVVIVDDVVTTGGTISACADALHAAGATDIAAVAYALTPGR